MRLDVRCKSARCCDDKGSAKSYDFRTTAGLRLPIDSLCTWKRSPVALIGYDICFRIELGIEIIFGILPDFLCLGIPAVEMFHFMHK